MRLPNVAPRAGAWIETPEGKASTGIQDPSLPVRERGLKPVPYLSRDKCRRVAPRAGAWIETIVLIVNVLCQYVAPRAGAWIETTLA